MIDKNVIMSKVIRKRIITGLIQAVVLFGVLFGFSFMQGTEAGETAFSRAAVLSILMIFGYSINRVFNDLSKKRIRLTYSNAGTAFGMLIAGLGLWQLLVSFNEFRVWPGKLALIILCGITGTALSRLAEYRGKREVGLWWSFLGWLEDKPSLKFLMGILVGIYFIYLRPYLGIAPNSLILIEWFIFCVLAFAVLIRVWAGLSHNQADENVGANWRKHHPKITRMTGSNHDLLVRIERQFISIGEPVGLYVLLIILLNDNNVKEDDIVRSVEPLINFKGINQARASNVRLTRRASRQQSKMRKEALKNTFASIAELVVLSRSSFPNRNRRIVDAKTAEPYEKTGLRELKKQCKDTGEKSGLFTHLVILLHTSGRYHERIVSTLRELTDDNGNPSDHAIKRLTANLKK